MAEPSSGGADALPHDLGPDDFQVVKLLGVGSQGKVYLVRLRNTDSYFAMKVFKKSQIIQNEKTTDSILTEHRFLATSIHPFITKLLYSFHTNERLFMVMEYCPGGELFTAIKKQPEGRLLEDQVRFYTSEVVLVLEYIHSKGYIYRDLKPENILLHLDGHIRMADFGLSKQHEGYEMKVTQVQKRNFFGRSKMHVEVDPGEVVRTNSLVGSVHYLAPEVLQCAGYDAMADWWALGVLMYDMLFGFPPFQGQTNHEVFQNILGCQFEFPENYPASSVVKDLIKKLLTLHPRKRLGSRHGAADVKKHPFFNGIHWGLLRNRKPPIMPLVLGPDDTSNFLEYGPDADEDGPFSFFSELEEDPCVNPSESKTDARFSSFRFNCPEFDRCVPREEQEAATETAADESSKKKRKKKKKSKSATDATAGEKKRKKKKKKKSRSASVLSKDTQSDPADVPNGTVEEEGAPSASEEGAPDTDADGDGAARGGDEADEGTPNGDSGAGDGGDAAAEDDAPKSPSSATQNGTVSEEVSGAAESTASGGDDDMSAGAEGADEDVVGPRIPQKPQKRRYKPQ